MRLPRWPVSALLGLSLIVVPLVGCNGDGGGEGEGEGSEGEGEGEGGDGGVDGGEPDLGNPEVFPDDELAVVFVGEQREANGEGIYEADLFAVEKLDGLRLAQLKADTDALERPVTLESSEIVNLTEGTVSCTNCRLSPDHAWIGWTEPDPAEPQRGVILFAAPMDAGWVVNQARKVEVRRFRGSETLDDFVFAGDRIVYGKVTADGTEVLSRDLAGDEEHSLTVMADGGSLRAAPDGVTILLQEKVGLASLRLRRVAAVGEPAPELIHTFQVQGTTTGSDYSGNERSAISPDGKLFALLTEARPAVQQPEEFRLSIVSLDPASFGLVEYLELGPAGPTRCQSMRGPNEYNYSFQDPLWAPDGRTLYVLGMSPPSCGTPVIQTQNETDVLRIEVHADGTLGELVNLTDNPDKDFPEHLPMEQLALSPSGKYLIASAPYANRAQDLELYIFSTALPELRRAYPGQTFKGLRLQLTNDATRTITALWIF